MSSVLTLSEKVIELTEIWEDQADSQERYDPDTPVANTLRACSDELRRIALEHAPKWVSLRTVESAKGWSRQTLRRRCRELEPEGLARKTEAGEWEMAREAAIAIPEKRGSPDLQGLDIEDMARVLGRER